MPCLSSYEQSAQDEMTSSETNQQRLSALHLCHLVLQGECAGLMSLKSLVAVFPLCHYFSREAHQSPVARLTYTYMHLVHSPHVKVLSLLTMHRSESSCLGCRKGRRCNLRSRVAGLWSNRRSCLVLSDVLNRPDCDMYSEEVS